MLAALLNVGEDPIPLHGQELSWSKTPLRVTGDVGRELSCFQHVEIKKSRKKLLCMCASLVSLEGLV